MAKAQQQDPIIEIDEQENLESEFIKNSMNFFAILGKTVDVRTELDIAIQEFCETKSIKKLLAPIKSLSQIKSTSTDVERTFSLAGYVVAPRRATMKDDLLDCIIVTNKFYKSQSHH